MITDATFQVFTLVFSIVLGGLVVIVVHQWERFRMIETALNTVGITRKEHEALVAEVKKLQDQVGK